MKNKKDNKIIRGININEKKKYKNWNQGKIKHVNRKWIGIGNSVEKSRRIYNFSH